MVLLAVVSISKSSGLGADAVEIGSETVPAIETIKEVDKDLTNLRAHQWEHVAATHPGEAAELEKEMASDRQEVLDGIATYLGKYAHDARDKQLAAASRVAFERYVDKTSGFAPL